MNLLVTSSWGDFLSQVSPNLNLGEEKGSSSKAAPDNVIFFCWIWTKVHNYLIVTSTLSRMVYQKIKDVVLQAGI